MTKFRKTCQAASHSPVFWMMVGILVIGAYARFYDLSSVVRLEYDDQYNALLVYDLIKNHKLSLIGQEMSFGGMFLGPWHYLFLTPFMFLTNLNPIGVFVGEGVIGLLTIFSYFWIGRRLFSVKTALIMAFLRAMSMPLISLDHNVSPAFPAELVAIWFMYFLVRFQQGFKFALPVLALLFGLMFTVHLVILPLGLVFLVIWLIFKPIKVTLKIIGLSALAMLIPLAPQLIFETKYKFVHFLRLTHTLGAEGQSDYGGIGPRILFEVKNGLGNFYTIYDSWILPWWVGLFVFGVIILLIHRKKGEFSAPYHRWLLGLTASLTFIYYLIYPRHIPEYYMLLFVPLSLFYVSATIVEVGKSMIGRVIVGLFIIFIVFSNTKLWVNGYNTREQFNLKQKDQAVKAIVDHQRGKGEFSVSYFTEYGRHYGFQYLFKYYGLEPRSDIKPPIYSIVLPRSQVADKDLSLWFGDIGVIFPEQEPEQGK